MFIGQYATAQNNYWQQYLHYSIDAQLNDQEKTITGSETIVYKNNSPETLTYIWFHIYPNAYKDESTALFQQITNDPERKDKLKKIHRWVYYQSCFYGKWNCRQNRTTSQTAIFRYYKSSVATAFAGREIL